MVSKHWMEIGQFHFFLCSYSGMNVKISGVPWLWFFPGVTISRYIFPGGEFAEFTFFGVADSKIISGIILFKGSNCPRLNSRGFMNQPIILSRVYWFWKIWSSIIWIKNGTAHCIISKCSALHAVQSVRHS